MKKVLNYAMIVSLVFICASGMAFSRLESLLHEWCGVALFVCIILHLIINRKWFTALFRGKYAFSRGVMTTVDAALIVLFVLIVLSSFVISGYVFSFLKLSGSAWGRRIHLVGTAWLFLICGIHFGIHLKKGKKNIPIYVAAVFGLISFVICRFYERLFLLNEFVYAPNIPAWSVYLMHAFMFALFVTVGELIRNVFGKDCKQKETLPQ